MGSILYIKGADFAQNRVDVVDPMPTPTPTPTPTPIIDSWSRGYYKIVEGDVPTLVTNNENYSFAKCSNLVVGHQYTLTFGTDQWGSIVSVVSSCDEIWNVQATVLPGVEGSDQQGEMVQRTFIATSEQVYLSVKTALKENTSIIPE